MQRINDPVQISEIMKKSGLSRLFASEDCPFCLASFEKGEWVNALINPAEELLFLVRGEIRITDMRAVHH